MEIVSPILNFATQAWIQELRMIWGYLDKWFDFKIHPSCATHVHVGLQDRKYTLTEMKELAKTVLFFDGGFRIRVPGLQIIRSAALDYICPNAW
jgi:hypothetical protein